MTGLKGVFKWEEAEQKAWEMLKMKMTEPPLLAYPNFSNPYILMTDASEYAVSGILAQTQHQKNVVIAYISRSLSEQQSNWSVTEKEFYAIYYSCKRLLYYIAYGQKIQVETDHQPLMYLLSGKFKPPAGKLTRWTTFLMGFDITIIYKPGKDNLLADCLSRNVEHIQQIAPEPCDEIRKL